MIKGQLASLQRDHAWDGFSQSERTAGQALGAYNPYQSNGPAQTNAKSESFEKRQEREDLDYARLDGGDVERGRQARGAGAMRQAAEMADDKKKRDKEAIDRAELLAATNALQSFESSLADEYGDAFADNLFADLHEDGLVSEEDFKKVMSISDIEERRRAIAKMIQEGIDNGTIDPQTDLDGHEWAEEWLELDKAARAETERNVELVREGKITLEEAGRSAQLALSEEAVTSNSRTMTATEHAEQSSGQANNFDDQGQTNLAQMNLSGL